MADTLEVLAWLLVLSVCSLIHSGACQDNQPLLGQCGVRLQGIHNYTNRNSDPEAQAEFMDRIRRFESGDPIYIRLAINYDDTFKFEFANETALINFLRNMVYQTQLIYEQPEIKETFNFRIVVTGISYIGSIDLTKPGEVLIDEYTKAAMQDDFVDMSVIIVSATTYGSGGLINPIMGVATMGGFCSKVGTPTLLISMVSMSTSYNFAHELGHMLGAHHDGEPFLNNEFCDPHLNIMSPATGDGRNTWSDCSVQNLMYRFASSPVYECIYNKYRTSKIRFFSREFDFTPKDGNTNREKLPGWEMSLDMQCMQALGPNARSSFPILGKNGRANGRFTCFNHICLVDGMIEVYVGPAPSGSPCAISPRPLYCSSSRCGGLVRPLWVPQPPPTRPLPPVPVPPIGDLQTPSSGDITGSTD